MSPTLRNATLPTIFLAAFPPLFWAGNFFIGRLFSEVAPPFQLSFWRWVLAVTVLLPFSFPALMRLGPVVRREWPYLALLGALGVTGFNCLIYLALDYTSLASGAVTNATLPIMTLVIAAVLLSQPISRRQIAGLVVCVLGTAIIISRGSMEELLALNLQAGDLIVLAGVLCWSLYTVLIRWRPSALVGFYLVWV